MSRTDYLAGAESYRAMFPDYRRIRGESSTHYSLASTHPYAEVPERIAELVPHARFIYLVRDPIDRAVSHFAGRVTAHREERSIGEALDTSDPDNEYIAGSCYATQLEAFLNHFDMSAIMVMSSRELRDARRQALARIFEHLGADSRYWVDEYHRERLVRSADHVRLGATTHRFTKSSVGDAYRHAVPASIRVRIRPRLRRLLGAREVRPDLGGPLRKRLVRQFEPEAERLRALTGQPFDDWSV